MADIVISSGHGKIVRGAAEYLDEVDEARRVVDRVALLLREFGANVETFHDNTSTTQDENLETIVAFHNSQNRVLDVSVHFNAYVPTPEPMGTEVLYYSGGDFCADVSDAIAKAGDFPDRGPKKRTDLYFLNNTEEEAILIEVCFVDSMYDSQNYVARFEKICEAIAKTLGEHIGYCIEEEDEEPLAKTMSDRIGYSEDQPSVFSPDLVRIINEVAVASAVAEYQWEDRGTAPIGYIKGLAFSYAQVVIQYQQKMASAREMAKADTGDSDVDALTWYLDEFADLGMNNSKTGLTTLRHLFVLLMGLGMRESSGQYCVGRDTSAENTTADTAEAGLFQMSWNASSSSDFIVEVYDNYSSSGQCEACLLATYGEGVVCSSEDFECYGDEDEDGYKYQKLAKECPQFAVEAAAIGLRNLRQHWGPINRLEAEVTTEADDLFQVVEDLVMALPSI